MNNSSNGTETEQLEWDFEKGIQSMKVKYDFNGYGSSEHLRDLVKSDLIKIVGGNGDNIPKFKLAGAVRAEIENTLKDRGFNVEFKEKEDEIIITQAPQDRSGEYDESYRLRA